MKQSIEEAAHDYATKKTKFRKDVLKEVDADTYVSRHADCMEDFQCGYNYKEQSMWISIDEQFPEDKQPVLCSSQIYGKVVLCWDELSQSWSYPESDDFYCEWNKVDCWMLIPEG